MRRIILTGLVLVLFVVPAIAQAARPTHHQSRLYEQLYHRVATQYGKREPGRNIVIDGSRHGAATRQQVVVSIDRFRQWLTPKPAVVYTAPTPVSAPTSQPTASYATSGYSIPAGVVQCESGGNWSAVNSSSGAGGAYQILPSTWAAYGGTGSPQDASPAEQSAIAAKIYAAQGPSAWTC